MATEEQQQPPSTDPSASTITSSSPPSLKLAPLSEPVEPELEPEPEPEQQPTTSPPAVKRGPGRPRGSSVRNRGGGRMTNPGVKKSLVPAGDGSVKRKRGRPPKKDKIEKADPTVEAVPATVVEKESPSFPSPATGLPANFLAHPVFYEKDPLEEDLLGPGMEESSSEEPSQTPTEDSGTENSQSGIPQAPEDNVMPHDFQSAVDTPSKRPPQISRVQALDSKDVNSSSSAESSRNNSPNQGRVRGRGRGRPRGRPKGSGRSSIQRLERKSSEDLEAPSLRIVNGITPKKLDLPKKVNPAVEVESNAKARPMPMKVKSRWRRSSEMDTHSDEHDQSSDEPLIPIRTPSSDHLQHPSLDWNRKPRIQLKQLSPNTLINSSSPSSVTRSPAPTSSSAPSSSNNLVMLSTPPSSSLRPRHNRRLRSRSPSSSPDRRSRSKSSSPRRKGRSGKIPDEEENMDWMDKDDINALPETKAEIKARLDSFQHIKENNFLCERYVPSFHFKHCELFLYVDFLYCSKFNKQCRGGGGMECDCTITREEINSGKKGCGDNCLNRLLMIECSKYCSLGKYCGNKKFQTVDNAPVEVFKTHWKGFGLRAVKSIQA